MNIWHFSIADPICRREAGTTFLRMNWKYLSRRSRFINRNSKWRDRLSDPGVFTDRRGTPGESKDGLGIRSIASTAVYTALAPSRFNGTYFAFCRIDRSEIFQC
jgi:hypothetical protein